MGQKGLLTEVVESMVKEMEMAKDTFREFQSIPLGMEKLSPAQVKRKYGLSVTEMRNIQKREV